MQLFALGVLVLIPLVAFAVYTVSPRGVFLPGAIGAVISLGLASSFGRVVSSVGLAYVAGVSAIFLTVALIAIVDSDTLFTFDDELRLTYARVTAGVGTLSAFAGACAGCLVGKEAACEGTTQRHAPSPSCPGSCCKTRHPDDRADDAEFVETAVPSRYASTGIGGTERGGSWPL